MTRSLSALLLALSGAALIVIGLYFVVLRPALLPEDLRFVDQSLDRLAACAPHLADWLANVFRVMGGYILATGVLTIMLALTSFRERRRGAAFVAAVSGLASIGSMAIVNFAINSDFKWVLFGIALMWASSLGLFYFEKKRISQW